jgi:tRNA (guanine37-N1)-methyltransferase
MINSKKNTRRICIISLIPKAIESYLGESMMLKASKSNIVNFTILDLREFGIGDRKQIDDTIYGGGDGMLLMVEPLFKAIKAAKKITGKNSIVIITTPRGSTYTQEKAEQLSSCNKNIILICPRYEGYDERIIKYVDEQICVGQYILTGGDLPALSIVDSIVRLIPGVLGGDKSAIDESFTHPDLIEHPHYTRPLKFKRQLVPDVLLSGNHAKINKWRQDNMIKINKK